MELKLLIFDYIILEKIAFQSYLYGIEITYAQQIQNKLEAGFNRTFMELKWGLKIEEFGIMKSFNRTFMELK